MFQLCICLEFGISQTLTALLFLFLGYLVDNVSCPVCPRLVSMSCQQCICVWLPIVSPVVCPVCLCSVSVASWFPCLVEFILLQSGLCVYPFPLSSLCVLSFTFLVSHVSMSVYRRSLGHVHKSQYWFQCVCMCYFFILLCLSSVCVMC